MPRFVLLIHDHPTWHWDLMLEDNGALRTWRLDSDPCSGQRVRATPLPAHRLVYLEYEGPVSGQRGTVQRWDGGDYQLIKDSSHRLELNVCGTRMKGRATLTTEEDGTAWFEFTFEPRE